MATNRHLLALALALGLATTAAAPALAQPSPGAPPLSIPLGARQHPGHAVRASQSGVAPHVASGAGVSIVTAYGRLANVVEPHPDDHSGAFALLHGPGGSIALRAIEVDGRSMHAVKSVPAPDGGALVSGIVGTADDAPTTFARIGRDGAPLWVARARVQAAPGCNPRVEMCAFSVAEAIVAHGDRAWAIVAFQRGTLHFDGGATMAGRASLNHALLAIDLTTGAMRATPLPVSSSGDPGLLHRVDPRTGAETLVFVGSRVGGARPRATLAVYDANTLRQTATIRLTQPGVPDAIVLHADGIGMRLETPDARRFVASIDTRGRERFRFEVPYGTVISGGPTLFVARPVGVASRSYPYPNSTGELVAESLHVQALDARGAPLRQWSQAGHFPLHSLALHAVAPDHAWLSGARLDGPDATLFAYPVGTVVPLSAPPGPIAAPPPANIVADPWSPSGGSAPQAGVSDTF